jgi:hypothetical protein
MTTRQAAEAQHGHTDWHAMDRATRSNSATPMPRSAQEAQAIELARRREKRREAVNGIKK